MGRRWRRLRDWEHWRAIVLGGFQRCYDCRRLARFSAGSEGWDGPWCRRHRHIYCTRIGDAWLRHQGRPWCVRRCARCRGWYCA